MAPIVVWVVSLLVGMSPMVVRVASRLLRMAPIVVRVASRLVRMGVARGLAKLEERRRLAGDDRATPFLLPVLSGAVTVLRVR
jgi:hypothetical protein